jgi:hypothetical protein
VVLRPAILRSEPGPDAVAKLAEPVRACEAKEPAGSGGPAPDLGEEDGVEDAGLDEELVQTLDLRSLESSLQYQKQE